MQNFYIFLDIDGVLFDIEWFNAEFDKGNVAVIEQHIFKKESMEALNFLIKNLEKTFNVDLVISSVWRMNMERITSALLNSGLSYDKPIHRTISTLTPQKRAEEILQYLANKKDKKNLVVIDDQWLDYKDHFALSKIIKTDIKDNALSMEMVKKYIATIKQNNKYIELF